MKSLGKFADAIEELPWILKIILVIFFGLYGNLIRLFRSCGKENVLGIVLAIVLLCTGGFFVVLPDETSATTPDTLVAAPWLIYVKVPYIPVLMSSSFTVPSSNDKVSEAVTLGSQETFNSIAFTITFLIF